MGEYDPHRGHLAQGRERPAPRSPRPRARTTRAEVTSPTGEDDPRRGHLAHGRGRPALRSPRPWARTTRAEVTSPMGEDDPRRGHYAHGRGRPALRSPRPWARTTRTEVTSQMGDDDPHRGYLAQDRPPVPKPHERSCSAKTRPGKRRSPGRINILAIRSGQTDTKREGQMNKQNGEAANPNLRENYGISDLKFLKSDLEVL
ncbi:hypothetical protein Bca4012_076325 [Brassica carinata]